MILFLLDVYLVPSCLECLFRTLNLYYSWRRLLNQKHPMPRETMVFANLANSSYWGQSSLCYIVYTHANQYYGTILPIIIIIPPLFGYCVLTSHRLQIMTQTSICPAQCPSSVYNQRKKKRDHHLCWDIVLRQIMCRLWIWKISKTNKAIWGEGRVTPAVSWIQDTTPSIEGGKTNRDNEYCQRSNLE